MEKIVYYSDDPTLGINTVKTASGATEYRKNCKKIKGEYHTINKECFFVGDVWYRKSSGLIEYDYELQKWFLKKEMSHQVQQGVVGFEKGSPVMGFFSPNHYNNVQVMLPNLSRPQVAINPQVLLDNGFIERVSTGIFYSPKLISKNDSRRIENLVDHTTKGYNVEDNGGEFALKKELYAKYPLVISKDAEKFGKMLGNTTFGVEIECDKGYMPDFLQSRHGVLICRDGSLKDENGRPGPEFVTIPLQGAKGIQNIVAISSALRGRTSIDLKCSLHIHLGGVPTTRLFLVALYRLAYKIQNEIFQLFPYYKANPEGVKQKNYNQKLPSLQIYSATKDMSKTAFDNYIDEAYKRIYTWLADSPAPDNIFARKVHKHPREHKWDRPKRYFWMNVMNMLFSERNTVEFRPHTPTTNATKMLTWLFICNAIVKYAELNADNILMKRASVKLDDILDYYGETFGKDGRFLSDYLKAYVISRKEAFYQDYKKGDHISKWDMIGDESFIFNYEGITQLI